MGRPAGSGPGVGFQLGLFGGRGWWGSVSRSSSGDPPGLGEWGGLGFRRWRCPVVVGDRGGGGRGGAGSGTAAEVRPKVREGNSVESAPLLGAFRRTPGNSRTRVTGHRRPMYATTPFAVALKITRNTAFVRLHLAVTVTTRLPQTLAALERGEIDLRRVQALAEIADPLPRTPPARWRPRSYPTPPAEHHRVATRGAAGGGPARPEPSPGPAHRPHAGPAGRTLPHGRCQGRFVDHCRDRESRREQSLGSTPSHRPLGRGTPRPVRLSATARTRGAALPPGRRPVLSRPASGRGALLAEQESRL